MNDLKQRLNFGNSIEDHIETFIKLVKFIRPSRISKYKEAEQKIISLTEYLKTETEFRAHFCQAVLNIIDHADFTRFFSETGIPIENSVVTGIYTRIKHKILPALEEEDGLIYIIHKLFYKNSDYQWIDQIDEQVWADFFVQLDLSGEIVNKSLQNQLLKAATVISYKIAYLGTDRDISIRVGKEEELITPFTEQNKEIVLLFDKLKNNQDTGDSFRHSAVLINQCQQNLREIIRHSKENGTSMHQSYVIKQLDLLSKRLLNLLSILNPNDLLDEKRFTAFFRHMIREENNRNSLRYFISNNMSLLSGQIVEHESRTGEHYITHNRIEFWKFFYASCLGGFIVSFLVIFKNYIHQAHFHIFHEAICFSVNYALGFVTIYLTGAALATKQPAMTASAIASAMANDQTYDKRFYFDLSVLIGKVWRSQMISFTGNLLIVFPLPLLFAYLIHTFTGHKLVEGEQAMHTLQAIHPLQSLCLFYAAITGVFLFLSGVFSGYVDNKMIYSQISARISKHPLMTKLLPATFLQKTASFFEKNGGAIAGNVLLGIFLGTSTYFGEIFHLPIDIRHITFSTGNFAVAAYGLDFNLGLSTWLFCIAGIIGIGFLNFTVSFSLAFYIAIKSRGVSLSQYPKLLFTLFQYLKKFPHDFFYAPKNNREFEHMREKV